MSDPAYELQGAIYTALAANPPVAGGRIYDRVPPERASEFPYITIGEADVAGDDNECWDASEVSTRIHVWSQEVGFPETQQLSSLVRDRLTEEFVLNGYKVTVAEHVSTRYLRDPDGLTNHAVVEMRYLIDHDMA